MRPPHALFTAGLLALFVTASPARGGVMDMTPWKKDAPLKAAAVFGPLKVVSVKNRSDPNWELGVKVVTFVDNAGKRGELAAVVAFDDVYATIGAGRLDPASPKDQILLTDYSGGAHCCTHFQLLDWIQGAWRVVDIGTFDGEPIDKFPIDEDGDGVADLVLHDDRFAYQFGCYACSWMPPRIFNVRQGRVIDVSAEPRYRKLFEADYAKAKTACEQPQFDGSYTAGYCAGMMADGVRLGRAEEAWKIVRSHVKAEDGDWPHGCRIAPANGDCPENQTIAFETYEEALRWFLAKNGY